MSAKLFVGKLSYNTTNDSLQALFAQYGKVISAQVIMDRETGRSKGFGFVEMEDQVIARVAIAELHEKEFEGRIIVVSIAQPREDRPRPDFHNGFQRR